MRSASTVTSLLASQAHAIPVAEYVKNMRDEIEYTKRNPIVGNTSCGVPIFSTVLVGNGNPHIDFWSHQVSDKLTCDKSAGCVETYTKGVSIGYSVDIGGELSEIPIIQDLTAAISFGFTLEKSYEVSTSQNCPGGAKENVCVWYYAPHSAVTVQQKTIRSCNGLTTTHLSDPFVMEIPLTGNGINGYYCVEDTCQNAGQGYWTRNVAPNALGPPV